MGNLALLPHILLDVASFWWVKWAFENQRVANGLCRKPRFGGIMMDLQSLAEQAAVHWPQITSVPLLFMQRENVVFRVDTTSGPHALRLHRPGYHSVATLRSELELMAMLAAKGVQVPTPAASANGALLVEVAGRQVSVLSWLSGAPMGRSGQPLAFVGADRAALFRAIGREMARLHQLTDHWTAASGFQRPAWDIAGLVGDTPFWGRFWDQGSVEDTDLLRRARDWAQDELTRYMGEAADYGLIHADLVNENVLVAKNELEDGPLVHFIDFDDSGYGFRLFDLATTLYKAIDEPDFATLQAALLAGYAESRPLPDVSRLPLFVVLRSLTYLGWIATRLHEPGMAEKVPRYLSIAKRLIARHMA